MSTKKKNCNIVLLAEESADKIQSDRKHLILTEDKRLYNPFKNEYYNLYITCNDDLRSGACLYQKSLGFGVAKPEFGVLCFVTMPISGGGSITTPLRNFPDTRKVIATTDKELIENNGLFTNALLSIAEHFLITYISQYNSGNIINNVDVTIGNGLIIIYEIEENYVERQVKLEQIECTSEEGVTIGLIDSIMTQAAVLNTRDLSSHDVKEALKDLRANKNLKLLLNL